MLILLYSLPATSSHFTVVLVYVDDILVVGNSPSYIHTLKSNLNNTFSIKDLGLFHYYLGIEFLRNSNSLTMSQRKYTPYLLTLAGVLNSKPTATPLDPNHKLSHDDHSPLPDPSLYRTLVGKLIYLIITRPDISFAAQALSQFSHKPCFSNMQALLRVLRYLKLCPGQGLYFPTSSTLTLTNYCDSDWASCIDSRKSITGFAIFHGSSLIS